MSRKPIPETTDAEAELADLHSLREEIEAARKVWEAKKLDAKEARETFEGLVDDLLKRLGEELPLLDAAQEE